VPHDVPLCRVDDIDQNGLKIVKFIGQRSFIHDFARPGRVVLGFRIPGEGVRNTSGRLVRWGRS
jgi:hypothetical protein